MFKNKIAQMLQTAQQIQENMQKSQAEIKTLNATGIAAGGGIKITLTGGYNLTDISIDDALMTDKHLLQDSILTAMNDAVKQIRQATAAKMKAATNGLDLPVDINLP